MWCLSAKLVETSFLEATMEGKRQGMFGHKWADSGLQYPL